MVDTSLLNNPDLLSNKTELDLLTNVLQNPATDMISKLMQRSMLTATGFAPFYYQAYMNAYLYNVNPNIDVLRSRT